MSTDNIYFNARINHKEFERVTNKEDTLAIYDQAFTNPIVNKASDYYVSVVEANLPVSGSNIPLWIANPSPNQGNSNLTTSLIIIRYLGVDYISPLYYIPNSNATPPVQNQLFPVVTDYYFSYSYENFVHMINIALLFAYNAAVLGGMPATEVPKFTYIPEEGKLQLIVLKLFENLNTQLFVNLELAQFLEGFYLLKDVTTPIDSKYQFVFFNNTNEADQNGFPVTGGDYWTYQQEKRTAAVFSPLDRIIITSHSLPIPNQGNTVNTTSGFEQSTLAFLPVLLQFNVNLDDTTFNDVIYKRQSDKLLHDLLSHDPIQEIKLEIFWQDSIGAIRPYKISLYDSASVTLQFIKKKK